MQIGGTRPSSQPLGGTRARTSPAAFGAGIGSALQYAARDIAGFSESLSDLDQAKQSLADAYKEREDKTARYGATLGLSRFADELEREFLEAQRTASPGAADFTNQVSESFRARGTAFLASLPPSLQKEFEMRLEPVLGKYETDAFRFQLKSQDDQVLRDFQIELDSALARVHQNPEHFEREATRLYGLLSESPLAEDHKADIAQKSRQALQQALFYGEVQTSYNSGFTGAPVADTTVPGVGQNFLAVLSGPESAGRYNIRFDGSGTGAKFTSYADHPRVRHRIPEGFAGAGKTSDAAGRYQFLSSTWDEAVAELRENGVIVPDFSPQSQDTVAWYVAQRDYKRKTGRSIEEDLVTNPGLVREALVSTWEGLGKLTDEAFSAQLASVSGTPAVMSDERFSDIPFDQRLVLLNKAESVGKARRREAQTLFLEGWEDELAYRAAHGKGPEDSPYTDENIAKMFPAKEAAELIILRDRTTDDGEMFSKVALASPEELAQYYSEAAAAVDDPENFKWNAERLNRLQQMVAARNKTLATDPVDYVLKANSELAQARQEVTDSTGAQAYSDLLAVEQTRLGVPKRLQRVLTEAEANSLVAEIAAAPLEERAVKLRAQVEGWGAVSDKVLDELYDAKLPAPLYYAAQLAVESPIVASEITAAIEADLKFPADQAASIRDSTATAFADFQGVVLSSDLSGEGVSNFQELLDVANSVVRLRVARGASETQAAEDVFEEMIGKRYDIRSVSRMRAYIPKILEGRPLDVDRIEDVAYSMVDDIAKQKLLPFTVLGLADLDAELTGRLVEDQAFWVTNADETGLALVVPTSNSTNPAPLPVRAADGGVIEVSFSDLMKTEIPRLSEAPSTLPMGVP